MAVSLPRLQKIETSDALPKNDRINMQVKDQASSIMNQTSAVTGIADKVGDIYQKYENDKIEQLSNVAEQEYSAWNAEQLGRLKKYQGDPTDAYVEYDKQAAQKREDILASRPDLNDRVKRHLTSRLDKTVSNQNVASMKQRGMQQEVYANNLYESTAKLKKDDLPVRAGYIRAGDKDSHSMFKEGMADITTLTVKNGLRNGTVTRLPDDAKSWSHKYMDDDGKEVKVSMSPMAKQRVAKDLSESVKSSIEVMIAGGQIEEAREMQEEYKGYIDPKVALTLDKKFNIAGRKDEANKVLGGLRGLSEDQQLDKIESISDPELKLEVMKKKESFDSKIQASRDRKNKQNTDVILKEINRLQDSGTPLVGLADLEDNPVYKNVNFDELDAKSQKVIREAVAAPKESNPKSLTRLNNIMVGDSNFDVETATYEDFQRETTGLSKADRTRADKWFKQQANPSAVEERMAVKRTNELVRDQLLGMEYIIRDSQNKITGGDDERLRKVQDKIINYYAGRKTVPSEKEMVDIAKKFAASEVNDKVFNPYTTKKSSQTKPASGTISPKGDPLEGLKPVEVVSYKADFQRKHGFLPSNKDPRFQKFVEDNKKKG